MAQAAQSVLIVDDDESVRTSLSMLLESSGHRTVTFASTAEFTRKHIQPGTEEDEKQTEA